MTGRDSIFELVRSANLDLLREALALDPSAAAQRDGNGLSAVLHARYRGNDEVLDAILAADPPLDVFDAAAIGRLDRVAAWIEGDPERVRAFGADGFTPLQLASYFGHVPIVEYLLARDADPVAVSRNPMQLTALHSAVAGRHRSIAAMLLRHGADAGAVQAGGFTPLHSAAQQGDTELVELLLEHGADPAATADDGRDAAAMAAERGHEALAARLRGET